MRGGRGRSLVLLALCTVAVACDGAEDPSGGSDAGPFGIVCGQPDDQRMQCVDRRQVVQGSALPATFDAEGCQVKSEVKNSCCNPAQAGPRLINGQCCYVFCERSCC